MGMEEIVVEARLEQGLRIAFRPFHPGEAEVIRDIHEYGHYQLLEPMEGEVVVDVGAHIGAFTLKTALKVGREGQVIALEPHPDNYELLLSNIKRNRLDNVKAVNAAVLDKNGEARLYLSAGSIAHSTLFNRGLGHLKVTAKSLDTILAELDCNRVDAVKIDAEGAEALVIRGGRKTFKTMPRVAVAAYHTPVQAMEVSTCLTKMGYQPGIEYARSGVYRAMQDHVPIIYGI